MQSVNKTDVVRIIKVGANGDEQDELLILAGMHPTLWEGLDEGDVLRVLRKQLRKEGGPAGDFLAVAPV